MWNHIYMWILNRNEVHTIVLRTLSFCFGFVFFLGVHNLWLFGCWLNLNPDGWFWNLAGNFEPGGTPDIIMTFRILSIWYAMSTRPSHNSTRFRAWVARINLEWNNFPSKNVHGNVIWNGTGDPQTSLAKRAISRPWWIYTQNKL